MIKFNDIKNELVYRFKHIFDRNSKRFITKTNKEYYDETIPISKFKSISKALFDRIYPYSVYLENELKRNKFRRLFPNYITVEFYGSSFIRMERDRIENLGTDSIQSFSIPILNIKDIRRITDINGNKVNPYKDNDEKLLNDMEDYIELLRDLSISYFKSKIGDTERIKFTTEIMWFKYNGIVFLKSEKIYRLILKKQ